MNRRSLLALSILAPIAACVAPTTVNAAAGDASAIASALQAIAPQLLIYIKDPALQTEILNDIAQAYTAAQSVQTATSNLAAPLVQQIIEAVQAISVIVLPVLGIPAAVLTVINAALALLPVLATAVGLSLAPFTATTMSPEQARIILKNAHA